MSDNAVSYYLQDHILEYITDGVTYTRYLALSVDAPSPNGTFTEVSGSGYARTNIYNSTISANSFPSYDGSSGHIANDKIISTAKATGTWTTANYWCIMTAVTSGSLLTWGRIYPSVTAVNNDYVTFPVGTIVIRCPSP